MTTSQSAATSVHHLHAAFVAWLPRIVTHGEMFFRHIRCPLLRDDFIAELVGLCWKWYVHLVQRGKDPNRFISALVGFAARRVRSGGRLIGMEKSQDAMSPLARRMHGFGVEKIPDQSVLRANPFAEALVDNSRTPILDQVAFRQDFPAWRLTRTERDQRVMDALMRGERPGYVSRKHGISPGRVSQLRKEFYEDWRRFCGEPPLPL